MALGTQDVVLEIGDWTGAVVPRVDEPEADGTWERHFENFPVVFNDEVRNSTHVVTQKIPRHKKTIPEHSTNDVTGVNSRPLLANCHM